MKDNLGAFFLTNFFAYFLKETLKIEENWQAETLELQTIIKSLKDENTQLKDMIESTKNSKPHRCIITAKGEESC